MNLFYEISSYVGILIIFVGMMFLAYTLGFRHLKEDKE